ncbi:MAG: FitA-like ribbon-helix-helix domain-containing protein [Cyanobium sp.]
MEFPFQDPNPPARHQRQSESLQGFAEPRQNVLSPDPASGIAWTPSAASLLGFRPAGPPTGERLALTINVLPGTLKGPHRRSAWTALQSLQADVAHGRAHHRQPLDEHTRAQLRIQAVRPGRSMEEEARTILREAIQARQPGTGGPGPGSRVHAHSAQLGGVELDLPGRSSQPSPARLEEEAFSAPRNTRTGQVMPGCDPARYHFDLGADATAI